MTYTQWLLQTIREHKGFHGHSGWLEEMRFQIAPLIKSVFAHIEEGQSVVVLTDEPRDWFAKYILTAINSKTDRPLLPFVAFNDFATNHRHLLSATDGASLIQDMLSIAFPGGCVMWYVGISNHRLAGLTKQSPASFTWIMDEELPSNITLSSKDVILDLKLLQLFKLFDLSLSGGLYGEFEFD